MDSMTSYGINRPRIAHSPRIRSLGMLSATKRMSWFEWDRILAIGVVSLGLFARVLSLTSI